MKKLFIAISSLCFSATIMMGQTNNPLWLRHQQISPDGKTIAFCYKGDIYTIPTTGGIAKRITANPAYDGHPIWSPDSKLIAFSSNREGSDDIYVVGKDGGNPLRLTFNSGNEEPNAFLNDSTILYNAYVMPDATFDQFPSPLFRQVYSIDVKGGRPHLFSSLTMEQISVNPTNGDILYTDKKGYEDPYRKHEKASICRDIWLRSADGKHFTKLTNFIGEDRNAVWTSNDKGMYYLSEKDGCSNIYYRPQYSSNVGEIQITHYKHNPVRFLSVAQDGTLSFGHDGQMYTCSLKEQTPHKVNVQIFEDNNPNPIIYRNLSYGATSFAVSPDNKEVAFVIHGDVYVANVEFGTTKRITNTPEQERSVDFSPDGRKLLYASERNGHWNIYMTEMTNPKEKLMCYAHDLKEVQLTNSQDAPCFQPLFSPDGKKIAFLRNRTEIMGMDLKTKKQWIIMPGKYEYSYQDGDQHYNWSPDGKWILTDFIGIGGWNNQDLAIFASDGSGKYTDLTQSGYNEGNGTWVLGGKAILFTSDRAGLRSHGSWGAQDDIYIMFLDSKAYDHFKMTKEDRVVSKDEDESANSTKTTNSDKKKDKKGKKNTQDSIKKIKPIVLDLENRDARTIRLTMASGNIGSYVMNADGTKLYFIATYGDNTDLWQMDLLTKTTKRLVPNIDYGRLVLGKDGSTLFLGSGGGMVKISAGGSQKQINISAPFQWQPAKERQYIFDHAWEQVKDKFYDPKLHGVNWAYYKKVYAKFLPYINNDRDFAEMLSEMLGELNASHTGARDFPTNWAQPTAALGAFFDNNYKGNGLKIQEMLLGSPMRNTYSKIKDGMIITAIDGHLIYPNDPISPLLNGKVGKRIELTVLNPKTNKTFKQIIKPISQGAQLGLLYRRWIKQREDLVKKWSNGKIGYIYIKAMNSPSFRTSFQDLLGKYRNCDAVVVDTRYNGGGWLHEDLAILLSGKFYMKFTPRGQYIGSDPFMQWCKPSCVLMSEGNYSNGSGFPWLYQKLKLGKLIGAPVPGTMTAVWWETQINPHIVFGIPQVTCEDMQGHPLENQEIEPDILVYNTPLDYESGNDVQLKTAVEEMMKETKKHHSIN